MTPKRSPLDSAYGSVSPYVQLPSVGKFSDIGNNCLFCLEANAVVIFFSCHS